MIEGPKGWVGLFEKPELALPNPLETHLGTSRWQSCNCETCQRKRMMIDSLPGEKIDWSKFRKEA